MATTLLTTLLGTALIAAAESPVSRSTAPTDPSISQANTPTSGVRGLTMAFAPFDRAALPTTPPITQPPRWTTAAARSGLTPAQPSSPFARPVLESREAKHKVEAKLPPTRLRARGDATWYCVPGVSACHRAHAGGMYAAAGAELRVGDWRGRRVSVCRGDTCVRVTLIDWCACAGDRVIDLYGDAYRRLAPLSKGVLRVSVRW